MANLFDGLPAHLPEEAFDWVDIPAHRRHRVEWTAPGEPTVWLALHLIAVGSPGRPPDSP